MKSSGLLDLQRLVGPGGRTPAARPEGELGRNEPDALSKKEQQDQASTQTGLSCPHAYAYRAPAYQPKASSRRSQNQRLLIRALKTLPFALNIRSNLRLETMRIARDAHAHDIEPRGPVFFVASVIDAGRSASGAAGARATLCTVEGHACAERLAPQRIAHGRTLQAWCRNRIRW